MWHLVGAVRRNIQNMMKSSRVADESMFEAGNNIGTRQHGWSGFSLVCTILQAPISVLSCASHPHVNGPDDDGVWITNEFAQISDINHLMKCGKIDEQIDLLKRKLKLIYHGEAFNRKLTKTARSHGKKVQVSIKQETSRLLGNLGWAYMQKMNYVMAEVVYRKAQMIGPDCNKACNLGLCLIRQARYEEAQLILEDVLKGNLPGSDDSKSRERAQDLLTELRLMLPEPHLSDLLGLDDELIKGLEQLMNEWNPVRSKRLPIFEEISSFRDQLAC